MNNNSEVKFIDTSEEVIQLMTKLSKQALKAGGKVVTKILKQNINVRTGGLKKSIVAWAKIDKQTGQPYLDIGYRSRAQMRKRGVKFFVNPAWFEFGIKPHTIMTKQLANDGKSSYVLNNGIQKFGVIVKHPGMQSKNFLRNTVYNNISEIQKAEEEYLGQLTEIIIEQGKNYRVQEGDVEIE